MGINQQQSQSQQQQPVNVIRNVGTMVARGGYIGHDHVEHPDDVEGYDFGGPVRGAPMSFPSRPFMNPSTPMPSMAAARTPMGRMGDIFSGDPQARFGAMENLDTRVQGAIQGNPAAERIYGDVRGVMPRMLGFARGGMVMDDPIARHIEEQTGISPEAINRERSFEAGGVGEESEGYQDGGEVDGGGVTGTPINYDQLYQMAGDYGIPGAGPREGGYPVTPQTEMTPGGQKPQVETETPPPDAGAPAVGDTAQPPTSDLVKPPRGGEPPPKDPAVEEALRPKYRGPTGPGSPNYVPPSDTGVPGAPQVPPGMRTRPNPDKPGNWIVEPDPNFRRGPDPTTKQWPAAIVPAKQPYAGDPRFKFVNPQEGDKSKVPERINPDAAPGGRYRAYTPISLVAGPPAGTNARDPMTGERLHIEPGELDQPEDVSITGRFGRRLAAQTSLGAARMLELQRQGAFEPEEIRRELRRRRDRGYAGGGVVGTTSPGFIPSGPVGGAPIIAGAPSFTSEMPRGMARGGPVAPTTGGFVSQALSPSGGGQVDDVPARLNEGEYVIPRDVVQFKGKEFFHKLIMQARKNREAHQQSYFGGARG